MTSFDGLSQGSNNLKAELSAIENANTGTGIKKLSNFKTYFAVCKAYTAINVLLLPRSFANGGYILSPIALFVACAFETLCAARLSSVALKCQIFSYPLLMKHALGDRGLLAARICISIAHWQFVVGQLTFTLQSL